MTKIRHYIHSVEINQRQDQIKVIFREKTDPEEMAKYVKTAIDDWKKQGLEHMGLGQEPPKDVLDQIRQQRFKNEFMMVFPRNEWDRRGLQIFDEVEIDMPLQLSDIESIQPEVGV